VGAHLRIILPAQNQSHQYHLQIADNANLYVIMNCPYCQQPCKLDDRSKFAQVKAKNDWEHWECFNHKRVMRIMYNTSMSHTCYTFYSSPYKHHQYRIRCMILGKHQWMDLLEADSEESIIYFPFISHNINPDNIDDKLPMLLTFM
jgi:hypothetical protein